MAIQVRLAILWPHGPPTPCGAGRPPSRGALPSRVPPASDLAPGAIRLLKIPPHLTGWRQQGQPLSIVGDPWGQRKSAPPFCSADMRRHQWRDFGMPAGVALCITHNCLRRKEEPGG
jgi:hypothetical protein